MTDTEIEALADELLDMATEAGTAMRLKREARGETTTPNPHADKIDWRSRMIDSLRAIDAANGAPATIDDSSAL